MSYRHTLSGVSIIPLLSTHPFPTYIIYLTIFILVSSLYYHEHHHHHHHNVSISRMGSIKE